MTDDIARRLAAGNLADDQAQLRRRAERLAAQYDDIATDALSERPVADLARRLATDALEIAIQATRVDAGRQTLVLLAAPAQGAAAPGGAGGE